MAAGTPDSTGAEALTVESAAESVFGSYLSEVDEEYREDRETPQAEGEQPEAPQAESEEAPEPSEEQEQAEPTEETEPTAETEEEPAPASTEKYKVKVDGKEEEVTLDELAKGYSRTADYTRKTQELAQHRKALESEAAAARQERAQLAQNLKLLEEAISEITPKEPNWEKLRVEHPDKFAAVWAEWNQGEKDRAEIRKQREEAEKKVAADHYRTIQETIKAEREKLLAAIPEWKDEKVEKAEKAEMVKFAESLNYTIDDLKGITDHRAFLLIRDAMRYRKSQEKKPALIKQIEKVRTTKPGNGQMSRTPPTALQRSLERLAKDRTREAAQSVFLNVLED